MLNFCFNTGQMINGKLLCSCSRFNGLFEVDIYTGGSKFIGVFPNEPIAENVLHRESFVYKNSVIFLPHKGKGISIYNVEDNTFGYYDLGENERKPMSGCLIEDMLWLFAIDAPSAVMSIDLKSGEQKKYPELEAWNQKRFQRVVYGNGSIWVAVIDTNTVIEFIPDSTEVILHKIPIKGIQTISMGSNGLWLISSDIDYIYYWKFDNHKISKFSVEGVATKGVQLFAGVLDEGQNVFLLPLEFETIRFLDKDKFCKIDVDYANVERFTHSISPFFLNKIATDRGWLMFPLNIDHMIFLDECKRKVSMQQICWNNVDDYPKGEYLNSLKAFLINEGDAMELGEFLAFVSSQR